MGGFEFIFEFVVIVGIGDFWGVKGYVIVEIVKIGLLRVVFWWNLFLFY